MVAQSWRALAGRPLDRWAVGRIAVPDAAATEAVGTEAARAERLRHVMAAIAANCWPEPPPPLVVPAADAAACAPLSAPRPQDEAAPRPDAPLDSLGAIEPLPDPLRLLLEGAAAGARTER